MSFGGQTLAGNNLPPGTPSSGPFANVFIGDYYQPSSSKQIYSHSSTATDRRCARNSSSGNLLDAPNLRYEQQLVLYRRKLARNWTISIRQHWNVQHYRNYNPYTTAPNTAHILWTKPEAFGGTIGGEFGGGESANFYATSQYEPKFAPIIMNGILYYTIYPGSAANPAGWAAVDLSTGQTLWTKNTTEVLRCGQILNMVVPNQYGALAYLWSQPLGSPVEYENLGASLGNF